MATSLKNTPTFHPPFDVLLVEDDLNDQKLTREAFKSCRGKVNLHMVEDGDQALTYLRTNGADGSIFQPDLVLLDLGLTHMGGDQLLAEIRGDEALRLLPVVILSSSRAQEDINRSYDLGANAYMAKPEGMKALIEAMCSLESFWLDHASLPVLAPTSPDFVE